MKRAGWAGFALTSAVIALITLTPQSPTSAHNAVSMAILNFLHRIGIPSAFSEIAWEFAANIIMFMPLGFFLLLATGKRRLWLVVAAMPATSCFIELSQLLFLPSRFPTISDIIANSTGGWLGIGLAMLTLAALSKRKLGRRK